MDLRLLEIFCCVYELMSFSRAAERLNLTQPTISTHIKTLEDHFGILLFDRLGREIQPTRAAYVLYQESSALSVIRQNIENAMNGLLKKQHGRLQLGASTIPGEYLLPAVLSRFHTQYPKIEINLAIADTREIVECVLTGKIEMGVVGTDIDHPELDLMPFASDQLVLVAAQLQDSVPTTISLKEFQPLPLVIREQGSGTRRTFEICLETLGWQLKDLNVVAELNSNTAIKTAVIHKLGVAVISNLAIQQELKCDLLRIVKLEDFSLPSRRFFTIVHKRRQRSPLCQLMIDYIQAIDMEMTKHRE